MEIQFSNIFCGKTVLFHWIVFVTLLKITWPPLISLFLGSGFWSTVVVTQGEAGSCSLWPCRPQCARLPCTFLSPGVCSNPRPASRWRQLTFHPLSPLPLLPSIPSCRRVFTMSGLCRPGGPRTYAFLSPWTWGPECCGLKPVLQCVSTTLPSKFGFV